MPRSPRIQFPGAVYHVMARGNRKSTIFEDDDDRRAFLTLLNETTRRYGLRTYGYAQMGNHYHLALETPRGNLADAMQFLNGGYAQRSNRRYGRTGHLFGERYRSLLIQREGYLRRVLRYVVLNPVRARLVTAAVDWPWSSYRATAGLEPVPDWLMLDWLDWAFEAEPGVDPRSKYCEYVNAKTARHARIETRAHAFGERAFCARMAAAAKRARPARDRALLSGDRPLPRATLRELLTCTHQDLDSRAAAVYNAHVTYGYRQSEIARELEIDPSTVSKILRRLRSTADRLASSS